MSFYPEKTNSSNMTGEQDYDSKFKNYYNSIVEKHNKTTNTSSRKLIGLKWIKSQNNIKSDRSERQSALQTNRTDKYEIPKNSFIFKKVKKHTIHRLFNNLLIREKQETNRNIPIKVIDNSAADEVGLFFIDMDKNEIVKHDEKFNGNKSSCFLKLKNENLLCSVVVENKRLNLSGSDDEEEKNDDKGRTDIQCWEIDETGLEWKLLYTKEKADIYPIFYMAQLNDGKIVTCSNVVKIYQ